MFVPRLVLFCLLLVKSSAIDIKCFWSFNIKKLSSVKPLVWTELQFDKFQSKLFYCAWSGYGSVSIYRLVSGWVSFPIVWPHTPYKRSRSVPPPRDICLLISCVNTGFRIADKECHRNYVLISKEQHWRSPGKKLKEELGNKITGLAGKIKPYSDTPIFG